MDHQALMTVLEQASKDFKKLKRHNPDLFLQYGRLNAAKQALRDAKAELAAAQKAWDEM